MALEMMFGDIHDDVAVYDAVGSRLEALAKQGAKPARLYCLGDFSDGINQAVLKGLVKAVRDDPATPAIIKKAKDAERVIAPYHNRDPATLTDDERAIIEKAQDDIMQANALNDNIFAEEARQRYEKHETRLAALKKKHGIDIYGVAGNHDNVFIYDNLRSATLLENGQPLLAEKVVGAVHSTEINETFAGQDLRYAVPIDDHEDAAQSQVYQQCKDAPVDLIVTHKESNHPGDNMPSGKGLLKLAVEKKAIQYAGHFHNAYIRRDPKTGVVVCCPGQDYIMIANREGNRLRYVDIYKIPAKGRRKPKQYAMAA